LPTINTIIIYDLLIKCCIAKRTLQRDKALNPLLSKNNRDKKMQSAISKGEHIVDSKAWRGAREFIDPRQQVVETRMDVSNYRSI